MQPTSMILIAALLVSCVSTDTQSSGDNSLLLANGAQRFMLDSHHIDEASGLTKSTLRDDLLWVHNDSGSGAHLFAIDTQGRYQGQLTVQNAQAKDWEDIASFSENGQNFLLIADVGDNRAWRSQLSLYLLKEPDTRTQTAPFTLNTQVIQRIDFQYEDGARDVESLAVDTANQHILLLSKRDTPPRLYRLPLYPSTGGLQTATFVVEITTIPPPTREDLNEYPRFGYLSSQPTAMDIHPDGNELLIVTYKDSYRYPRIANQPWAEALAELPIIVDVPQLPQTEAGGYSRDGRRVYIASEQLPAALVMMPLQPPQLAQAAKITAVANAAVIAAGHIR